MSAFTPPRADLRGGNQSEDSFATSRRIFKAFPVLCLFAGGFRAVRGPNQLSEGYKPLTSTLVRVTPRPRRVCWTSLSEHGFTSGTVGGCIWETDKPATCDLRGSGAQRQAPSGLVPGAWKRLVTRILPVLEAFGSRTSDYLEAGRRGGRPSDQIWA